MFLQERMEQQEFSPSEEEVIHYILQKQEQLAQETTTSIAHATYTSPSILVRIAKKLGYAGFQDFKEAFLEEVGYLNKNFKDLDPNQPFEAKDSYMSIAHKIAILKKETIEDTLELISHDSLSKAVSLLEKGQSIYVFGISNINYALGEFVFKLRHIGMNAFVFMNHGEMIQEAVMMKPGSVALIVSYSGESGEIIRLANILKKKHIPIIAITSIGDNDLSKKADVTLYVTTREKSFTKIGNFTSLESIEMNLDILYSCLFKLNYQENFAYKTNVSQSTESRKIDNDILKEEMNK